jgi:hypothetical protein
LNCWICGAADAATREHRSKASDLKALFGAPSQKDPLYFHSNARPGVPARRNLPIGSLKSDALKYTHRICLACNSARTQPHDRAWAYGAAELRGALPRLLKRGSFRANWLFPYDTRRGMRDLHLYFVKLFGCQIVEGGIPIDIGSFAQAILEGRPHANLYLAFGHLRDVPVLVAGGSDVHADLVDGQVAVASWLYQVGDLCVNVMYAADGEHRQGLDLAWHPRMGSKRLCFSTFGG